MSKTEKRFPDITISRKAAIDNINDILHIYFLLL